MRNSIPKPILEDALRRYNSCFIVNTASYYSYFERDGENLEVHTFMIKKGKRKKCTFVKKIAVHIVGKPYAYTRGMSFTYLGGYVPDMGLENDLEKAAKSPRTFVNRGAGKWYKCGTKYFRLYRKALWMNRIEDDEEFKYCGWDPAVDVITYLEKYRESSHKHGLEMLAKLCGAQFVMSKRIVDKCTKDRGFAKWLAAEGKNYAGRFGWPDIMKIYKDPSYAAESEIFRIRNALYVFYNALPDDMKARMLRYLTAHGIAATHYNDYLTAIQSLKLDLSDTKNLFPLDFEYWFDERIKEYAAAKYGDLNKRIKATAEKYKRISYSGGGFAFILADSKESLIKEGSALNHCVGKMSYDLKMANEESLIVFVRDETAADKPFVTVEIGMDGRLIQMYGKHNSRPEPKVEHAITEWAKKAQRKLRKMAA